MRETFVLFWVLVVWLIPELPFSAELYKAEWVPVTLRAEPRPQAKKVGVIPEDEVVEVIERHLHWIKVKVGDTVGWAVSTTMKFVGDEPGPIIEVGKHKSLYTGGKYKTYIVIRNVGPTIFDDSIHIYVYSGQEKIFEGSEDFRSKPIPTDGAAKRYLETDEEVTDIRFEISN